MSNDQSEQLFTTIGFLDQQREKHLGTSTSTVVPWLPVQFSRHDHTSSTGKNPKIKYQDSTTAEQQGTEIMSMDSEPYCEDNCHDTGDWRSTASCEISTEGPSKSTQ
ncbi:uncharacterized protein RHIMIDRAFT_295961, partial [Rhizopus microsporus ATCC 52813]